VLVGADAQVAEGSLVSVLDPCDSNHLGADEAGPVAAPLAPERLDADARHRGENKPSGDLDGPEEPVVAQVDVHSL
jgi:hypothetical protein